MLWKCIIIYSYIVVYTSHPFIEFNIFDNKLHSKIYSPAYSSSYVDYLLSLLYYST